MGDVFDEAEGCGALDKEEFEALEPKLRTELLTLQRRLRNAGFPVLIVIGGVDGAGKGDTANLLHEWMDARYLRARAFGPPTEEEAERPPAWRFWMAMPPKGRVGIFFGSWYTRPIMQRVLGGAKKKQLKTAIKRIRASEKLIVDEGALVIKLWFHLSKKEQKTRLKGLEADPSTRWRVSDTDWHHFERYDAFRKASAEVLEATDTKGARWIVVPGADPRRRAVIVARHLIAALSAHLESFEAPQPKPPGRVEADPETVFDDVDLSLSVSKKKYNKKLEALQGRLNYLSREARACGLGATFVFEGWDAGGKGGAIRRVTRALDARQYQLIPIAAPSDEEKAQHYLWRFWRHIPRRGNFVIYDRSWYGRVLVERVEGFATKAAWSRAYKEIRDFEKQLTGFGIALAKFWLHISPEEQLRRFKERERIPYKKHKITEEDYRNREKWADYELAAAEMIKRTDKSRAPWHIIPGDSKHYARLAVLEKVCETLEQRLEEGRSPQ